MVAVLLSQIAIEPSVPALGCAEKFTVATLVSFTHGNVPVNS